MAKEPDFGLTLFFALIFFGAIIFGFFMFDKWQSEEAKLLKQQCPIGEKLTDYNYETSTNNTYAIECNNKVLEQRFTICIKWECTSYNKFNDCNMREQVYYICGGTD